MCKSKKKEGLCLLCNLILTRFGTGLAFLCASSAVIVIMLSAFISTHRAHTYYELSEVFFDFAFALNDSGSEHADIGTIAGQFNAACK